VAGNVDAADWLRHDLGVSKSLWGNACLMMGRELAAVGRSSDCLDQRAGAFPDFAGRAVVTSDVRHAEFYRPIASRTDVTGICHVADGAGRPWSP
jgi:hypothetical protein